MYFFLGAGCAWLRLAGLPARDEGQIIAQDVNRQRGKDKKYSNPEAPIAMGTCPVRTVGMRFVMVTVLFHGSPGCSYSDECT
jgi:hypothetical protein